MTKTFQEKVFHPQVDGLETTQPYSLSTGTGKKYLRANQQSLLEKKNLHSFSFQWDLPLSYVRQLHMC